MIPPQATSPSWPWTNDPAFLEGRELRFRDSQERQKGYTFLFNHRKEKARRFINEKDQLLSLGSGYLMKKYLPQEEIKKTENFYGHGAEKKNLNWFQGVLTHAMLGIKPKEWRDFIERNICF